ncbi:hypothetical protein J6590_097229, partial [Homalodisca vitripennis]
VCGVLWCLNKPCRVGRSGLAIGGEDSPSTPPTGFFAHFWTQDFQWRYNLLRIEAASRKLLKVC